MKKLLSYLFTLALILGLFAGIPNVPVLAVGTNYYIDTAGSNGNNGTSSSTPWADFTNVNSMNLNSGDQILLKRGCTWTATQSYWYFCAINGSGVTVDAYGTGANPALNGNGYDGCGFYYLNRDNLAFQNISFYNMSALVANTYTTYNHTGLTFKNIYLNNAKIGIGNVAPDTSGGNLISDIIIDGVKSENATGQYYGCVNIDTHISGDNYPMAADTSVQDVFIHNIDIDSSRGCAMGLANCSYIDLVNVKINNCPTDYAALGTTAIFLWKTKNMRFINCSLTNTPDSESVDQCAVDNEAFIDATSFLGCYIAGNAGAGVEYLNFDFEGDYNRNHVVDSCTFQNNALAGSPTQKSSLLAMGQPDTFTGTASNNIYRESTGFLTGNYNGWTISNNTSVASENGLSNSQQSFSGSQGYDNWSYQSYNGTSWSNLSYDSTNGYYGTSSNFISRFETLPDATSSHMTARTYTAPYSGIINIRGWAYLPYNNQGGDGVRVKITKNGTTQWGTQTISGTNMTGYSTNVNDLAVNAGDIIRFETDCGSSNNNSYDYTSWIPTIAYVSGGNLLTNPGFETGSTSSWSSVMATISANASARSGSYACLVSNRSTNAENPRQDIKNILTTYGQGNYSFGAWAKFASGSDGMMVVVLINDSNGNHWFAPGGYTTIGTSYAPLYCTANITWTGTLNSAYIYVQSQSSLVNLYTDDFSLSKCGNLLSNAGFETGNTSSWSSVLATIGASNSAHTGSYACLVSNRSTNAENPRQDIKGILTAFGQGNYRFSAWAKQASGTDGMLVVICINDSNGNHWYSSNGYLSVGTTYTQLVSGSSNITWTGTLNSAYIYVQNESSTANIYADDFSLIFS
ncbi:MAG: carbohydrate binding domain-containing protein [Saccharofermentanales bacterium]